MNDTRVTGSPLWGRISKAAPRVVVIIITVGFVVIWVRTLDFAQALGELRNVRGEWLVVAAAFYLFAWVARSERWRYLLSPTCRVSPALALKLTAVAQALNLAMPGRSGEVAVAIGLQRLRRARAEAVVPILVLDKVFELLTIVIIVMLSLVLGLDVANVLPDHLVILGAVAMVIGIGSGLFATIWLLHGISGHVGTVHWLPPATRSWLQNAALRAQDAIELAVKKPRPVFLAVACTLAALGSDIGSFWATFQAFGDILTIDRLILGILLFRLSSLLSITPGRVGSYELSATLIFSVLLGANSTRIGAISATRHIGVSILALFLGLICALEVRRTSARNSADVTAGVPDGVA